MSAIYVLGAFAAGWLNAVCTLGAFGMLRFRLASVSAGGPQTQTRQP